MTKLVHRELLLAKTEAVYGTDPLPTAAANAVLTENLSWSHAGLKMEKRPSVRISNAPLQDIYGGSLKTVTFDVDLRGSGAAGTAPDFDALLQACGMVDTIVAATSCSYAPSSIPASQTSCTIYYYEDGSLVKLTGCRGSYQVDLKAGQVPKIKFTMTGHWSPMTDVALPTPTLNATVPPAALGVPVALGAYSPIVETFMVDAGIKVDMVPEINAPDGYGPVLITERMIHGTIDPQADTVADYPFLADFTGGVLASLSTGVIGVTAGNRFQITMPAVYFTEIKPGARNGVRVYDCDYAAVENGANLDSDISIEFT